MTGTRHLVDPELFDLLELWPQVTLDETLLPLVRAPGRIPLGEVENPERVDKQELTVPGQNGAPDVPMLLYRPAGSAGQALPCLYHIHGGGYVGGAAKTMEPVHRLMVEALGCVLVSVDYRLAPETPFPGPLDDCYAGLAWLHAHAAELGIDPARIGIRGESAGGGLAAALALLVRDRGAFAIAFQQLIYPMVDDRTCTAAPNPNVGEFIWNAGSNRFGWRCYLGAEPGGEGVSSYAAAARAEDLTGLPPAFLSTGALDLFVDEDLAYAARLIRAGVPTELHVYPGGFHGFNVHKTAAVSLQSNRDAEDWLKRHLRG
jgi:acetyl esterase/lipase